MLYCKKQYGERSFLQGIGRLVEGMSVDECIARLSGISCSGRPTSCPDQLARALTAAKEA